MRSISKKVFEEMYNSMTNYQLADKLGVSIGTIKNLLKKYNIKPKGKGNRLPKSSIRLT
jgi:DNA-binding CsgD family transcriptional regulator